MVASHTSTVYSRLGLLGNPSDGMGGAAVAVSIENFFSTVTIEASDSIQIIAHVLHDATSFDSLQQLSQHTDVFGYYGGKRLIMVLRPSPGFCDRPERKAETQIKQRFFSFLSYLSMSSTAVSWLVMHCMEKLGCSCTLPMVVSPAFRSTPAAHSAT